MNERIIQRALRSMFCNYDYILFNAYMFSWESDFFCIGKSGLSIEVEVKISKADFRKDFGKLDKHKLLANHKQPAILRTYRPFRPFLRNGQSIDTYQYRPGDWSYVDFTCPAKHIPNKFYYACPEGLLSLDDIPAYAGLIYITNSGSLEVKKAPILHKEIKDHSRDLLSKYYWKHKNDRVEVLTLLNSLQHDVEFKDHHQNAINAIRDKFC